MLSAAMAGRLLLCLTFALSALGVSGLPQQSGQTDESYIGVPISNPDAKNPIPHKYIVVYNNTFSAAAIQAHQDSVIQAIAKRNIGKRSPVTGQLLSTTVKSYQLGGWRAMSLEADDAMVNQIFSADEVSYIEQDAVVQINEDLIQGGATNGLARLSHANAGKKGYVFDSSAGQGITAYVVDTGIRVTHSEFQGRATFGANFVNNVVCLSVLRPRREEEETAVCSPAMPPRSRTRTRMATGATLRPPSAARLLALPRMSTSSPSRF